MKILAFIIGCLVSVIIVLSVGLGLMNVKLKTEKASLQYKLDSAIEMRDDLLKSEGILETVVHNQAKLLNKVQKENIELKNG